MAEAAIIKKICAHNGSMKLDDLTSVFGLYDEAIESIISRSESCTVEIMNGQKTAIVRTKVRLCRAQTCSGCANLHLCKWFLFGSCRFDRGRRVCSVDQNRYILRHISPHHLDHCLLSNSHNSGDS